MIKEIIFLEESIKFGNLYFYNYTYMDFDYS